MGSKYSVEAYTHGLMLSFSGLSGVMSRLVSTVAGGKLKLWSFMCTCIVVTTVKLILFLFSVP